MALYPTLDFTPPGMFELPSGHLGVLPLDLEPFGALEIVAVHLSPSQDHSLRAWVSLKRGGEGLALTGSHALFWHLNRTPDEMVLLTNRGWSGGSSSVWRAEAPAGRVWLNVLNLINQPNAFLVRVTRLPTSGGPSLPPAEEPPPEEPPPSPEDPPPPPPEEQP